MFVNRATLIGFLGKNAELRHTRNEMPFAVLSLATKRSWKVLVQMYKRRELRRTVASW